MALPVNHCDPDQLRRLTEGCLPAGELTSLEVHLRSCSQCQSTLDELASVNPWLGAVRRYLPVETVAYAETDSRGDSALDILAPSDWPDSLGRIGPYEVKGLLGSGGMAVVFKAVDPALNRTIAIKVLVAHLASCGAARQRFLREAKAAAAVVHEHVVAVHHVEETRGLPYLVMEYVPGCSLQERLDRQGPLALPEILRIGMQVAAGLAAAHAQGLVHRDVKPANILLENGMERARLTDFGLARAVSDAALTQSGIVAGTPQYMAPEQARGEAVDHRADLFSLGSTLYAMCTGHPPFRAESAVAVVRRVSDDEPRSVRELNPEVPAWFAAIIAKLHAKDPAQRYQSAAEVSDLLGGCLTHLQQPLSVSLPHTLTRAADPHRRRSNLARWAMALVLLLSSLTAVPLVWRLLHPPPVEEISAAKETEGVRQEVRREDIEQRIHTLRVQTEALESAIEHSSARDSRDPVGEAIQNVLKAARSLEQELQSGTMGGSK
jgi:serine/threonine protein kinase